MTTPRLLEFDAMALSAVDDPYPIYAELRAGGPLAKGTIAGSWAITTHAEVSAALRDQRLGHRFPREYIEFVTGMGASADLQQDFLLNHDPPDHTRLRALMSQAFKGLVVRKLRDHITELVDDLLDRAIELGTFDVIDELAYPLPVQVICHLLNIDDVDRDRVRGHATALVSPDQNSQIESADWLRDYMGGVLREREPDPEGDLLQRMLAAEDGEDAFTHHEIVANAVLLFFAGFETTTNLIGNGCAALLGHPDQKERLWNDPDMAPLAVEEFLRYDPPVPFVNRITLEPIEIAGHTIKPQRWVVLLLASANRDEAVFDNPADLDISRKPNPHIGFGGGIHHCLGAMLARLEGEIAFKRLAERARTFEAAGAPQRRVSGVRSLAKLPVAIS
ncbi:MAG TPA: cytochrome P450 [Actinomycetota bacterium]|nr:cytochrome P450 [Actinomycetota bacterium]